MNDINNFSKIVSIQDLKNYELMVINGGTDAAPGSYAWGYFIGTMLRVAITTRKWIGVAM